VLFEIRAGVFAMVPDVLSLSACGAASPNDTLVQTAEIGLASPVLNPDCADAVHRDHNVFRELTGLRLRYDRDVRDDPNGYEDARVLEE
jgi:hypothetical protein